MKTRLILLILTLCFVCTGVNVSAQESTVKIQDGNIIKQVQHADVSELILSKTFEGVSIETSKTFQVGAKNSLLKMQLRGIVKSGKISVTLIKPDGNEFKTIEIDETSNVEFEQTLYLKEKPAEWVGDWKLKIKTDKAEGKYRLLINTR